MRNTFHIKKLEPGTVVREWHAEAYFSRDGTLLRTSTYDETWVVPPHDEKGQQGRDD
jgi:hypothetical protein